RRGQAREGERAIPADERIARNIKQGNFQRAADLYFALGGREERRNLASEDILALGDYLLQAGRYDQALSLFRRVIAERPSDPNLDRAYLGAGKAMSHNPRGLTSAYHYFLSALDVARTEETAREARGHLRSIERSAEG
ncbi:MAG: tetratricopeptide repeat protein, partial [Desulfuromonadales bacterium]